MSTLISGPHAKQMTRPREELKRRDIPIKQCGPRGLVKSVRNKNIIMKGTRHSRVTEFALRVTWEGRSYLTVVTAI